MGLDQYLYAKKYYSGGSYSPASEQEVYSNIVKAVGVSHLSVDMTPSIEVTIKVAQWRKANQVHGWFVDNVQHGEDDCREYEVSRDDLHQLMALCNEVLAKRDNDVAEELLPTTAGFFFGSDDIDEYYYADLEYTVKTLATLLEDDVLADTTGWRWEFYYQSSW